jgi:hypothetical protein
MTSQSEIFAFIDAVKAELAAHSAAIGSPTVYERDDKPFKVADGLLELPIVYVIPFADGSDDISYQWPDAAGGGPMEHDFEFSILAYYEAAIADLNSAAGLAQRRTILGYLLNMADLFKGTGAFLATGAIYAAKLEQGYFDDKGNVIAGGMIHFKVKMMTQP